MRKTKWSQRIQALSATALTDGLHKRSLCYRVQTLLGRRVYLKLMGSVKGDGQGEAFLVSVRSATQEPIMRAPGLGYEFLPKLLRETPPENLLLRFAVPGWMDKDGAGYDGLIPLNRVASLRAQKGSWTPYPIGRRQRCIENTGSIYADYGTGGYI